MGLNIFAKHISQTSQMLETVFIDKTGLLTPIAHDLTTETCINSNLSSWVRDLWHLLALGLKSSWCWGLYYLGGWCVYSALESHSCLKNTFQCVPSSSLSPGLDTQQTNSVISLSVLLSRSFGLSILSPEGLWRAMWPLCRQTACYCRSCNEREVEFERECVFWNPLFSALSVSLLFTTLARAVPYDCFDGERRRAPISVSGCNYSLEGPHLAVGSRHTEGRERGRKGKKLKTRKNRRWDRKGGLREWNVKKYSGAKSLRRGEKTKQIFKLIK